jgi:hypothetical protein
MGKDVELPAGSPRWGEDVTGSKPGAAHLSRGQRRAYRGRARGLHRHRRQLLLDPALGEQSYVMMRRYEILLEERAKEQAKDGKSDDGQAAVDLELVQLPPDDRWLRARLEAWDRDAGRDDDEPVHLIGERLQQRRKPVVLELALEAATAVSMQKQRWQPSPVNMPRRFPRPQHGRLFRAYPDYCTPGTKCSMPSLSAR